MVNVKEKAQQMRQVGIKETNANEPLLICQCEGMVKVKTEGIKGFQDKSKENLFIAWTASGM